jgi:hypothetical protein
MAIPAHLIYQGVNKEFQFRDKFMMPLLVQLGFGIVVNYHGQREFGRDVIFGDIGRFGHIIYYGMQIKYETSISLSDSHSLIQDAEQATHNPFKHPQIDIVDEYWELIRILNDIADSAGAPIVAEGYRKGRAKAFEGFAPQLDSLGMPIEKAVIAFLTELNSTKSL